MKFVLILLFLTILSASFAQQTSVTISGIIKSKKDNVPLPYVNVVIKNEKDNLFVTGTVTNVGGRFTFTSVTPGNYILEASFVGYISHRQPLYVGSNSAYLDIATIELKDNVAILNEIVVTGEQDAINEKLDKKTYTLSDNISQSGGSVIQAMQNLPGVTVEDGKVLLRGNDRVAVLIDDKQTALTGFGNQVGLDNIPASAIERIEIINNPGAKYDANGNAGIINIIFKKDKAAGFNGRAGLALGVGALGIKKENLPGIRPQYQATPKINPSLSLNNKTQNVNLFLQADYLYTETLNKNEFVVRTYDDGTIINQQTKRNRDTGIITTKGGVDWELNSNNLLTISGFYSLEDIIDNGDEPFFNEDLSTRYRLWQFLEDEVKTTVMASANYQHKYSQPGHTLSAGFNYTFHREDEKYFFTNTMPTFTGHDAFKLLSDESVGDFSLDYVRPLRHGRFEAGSKLRLREIPTNMLFIPGINSPLDSTAGGAATYKEIIPALYGSYVFENEIYEAEIGLRLEYVDLNYEVDINHPVYESDGYDYLQPFPTLRLSYKLNQLNKFSLFYNRRVDRPNEVDIRIFPKYDDAEIIKVGNPALKPQFTNTLEAGFKTSWAKGYLYGSLYYKATEGTITRIASVVPGSNLIYSIFQNAGHSYNTGTELIYSQEVSDLLSFNLNLNVYYNQIDSFTVDNKYPIPNTFTAPTQNIYSWSAKWNGIFHIKGNYEGQITAIYLAPDIIPQGKIGARFSFDVGLKKLIQKGKGELFVNATDLFNTMVVKKEVEGEGFMYTSDDYYETQVVRMGYAYKF